MSETLDLNQGMDVEHRSFVVHPEDYECPVQCEKLEWKKNAATDAIVGFVLKLDADGATVSEYVSLVTTEKYSLEAIKGKISNILISFGIRKVGEKSPKLIDDIKRIEGGFAHARLKVDKFQSNQTGKWLEGNKIKRWLSAEEFSKAKSQAAAPAAEGEKKRGFNFG